MRYRRAAHTAWRTIADETVVLDLQGKRMFGLDPAAAFVWQTLEAMEDTASMLRALGSPAFGADEIEAFLGELADLGLVERGAPEKRVPVAVEAPSPRRRGSCGRRRWSRSPRPAPSSPARTRSASRCR